MDDELKALAVEALLGEFYTEYSGLVNEIMRRAEGLDLDDLRERIAEQSNPFSSDDDLETDALIDVYGKTKTGRSYGTGTVVAGLQDPELEELYVNGVLKFKRRKGEWQWSAK